MHPTTDHQEKLLTPEQLKMLVPCSSAAQLSVAASRKEVMDILRGQNRRTLLVTGPCSIADIPSAMEYARRLQMLQKDVGDTFLLVMRAYFQKPRTTVGWKGLVYDPSFDGSFQVAEGLKLARRLLSDLAEMGIPTATEALDPLVHEYLDDLVVWTAIGARTSESQIHREYASKLTCPVGFKNGVTGSLEPAVYGVVAARHAQRFLAVAGDGSFNVQVSEGNPNTHVILRGGARPNYDSVSVQQCAKLLKANGIHEGIVVDCSHGNSGKDPARQPLVFKDCIAQIANGDSAIRGLMLESNLLWGNQPMPRDGAAMVPGLSLTDACICWETTETLIRDAAVRLRKPKVQHEYPTELAMAANA